MIQIGLRYLIRDINAT